MPSPFPGMDPYLEAQPFWGDFHTAMIMAMKVALKKRVPSGYSVWSDVHVWIHEPDAKTRLEPVKPDAFVVASKRKATSAQAEGQVVARTLSAPATTLLPAIRKTGHRYLKIKETKTDRFVTVVELLSPTNKKRGKDRDDYLTKRKLYFAERINLVEIDFLRAGTRMPLGRPTRPQADYFAFVCRGVEFPATGVWPISLRDVLPDVPAPLNPED